MNEQIRKNEIQFRVAWLKHYLSSWYRMINLFLLILSVCISRVCFVHEYVFGKAEGGDLSSLQCACAVVILEILNLRGFHLT